MKTLLIGASSNPERYANMVLKSLLRHGHEVEAIGLKKEVIEGVSVGTEKIPFEAIHTVTLYLNPVRQQEYYDYIISLKPERVIFNPGTENPEFYRLLTANGIGYEEACTLVLLTTNQF
ncbi:CoA-binding protein [Flavobacterium cerinum]|uniref:CoA-binding protein n=1 Tax=Flavobacterium cerinum TaxID=2502784 RepID=A0ABY5IW04_9FLAO|nr:CoA-binding protein [Flavobacterium cerinum]UUC47008.1 CoA-binding protein [Flavobacterium cerinum]